MLLEASSAAKINLFLAVKEKMPDGYHEIETVFMPVPDLFDWIGIDINCCDGIEMICEAHDVPSDESNLCVKAARSFAELSGISPSWQIHLEKHIPVAAGLGGGSSNAATVLHLLNRFYNNPLEDQELKEAALGIGADVPYFLDSSPVLASGVGEKLKPIPVNISSGLVIVNPGFPVTAAWAYSHFNDVRRFQPPVLSSLTGALACGDLDAAAENCFNDLEFVLFYKFPLLEMIRETLIKAGCLTAHVSGSGPSLYGLCHPGTEERIAKEVSAVYGTELAVFSLQCSWQNLL